MLNIEELNLRENKNKISLLTVRPIDLTHERLGAAFVNSPENMSSLDHLGRIILDQNTRIH